MKATKTKTVTSSIFHKTVFNFLGSDAIFFTIPPNQIGLVQVKIVVSVIILSLIRLELVFLLNSDRLKSQKLFDEIRSIQN